MNLTDAYLAGYAGNTAKAYRRDLADWSTFFTGELLAATRSDINAYVRDMEARELSASTISRRMSAVSGLYAYAVAEDMLTRNPAEHVRRPKVSQDSQTLGLSQDEARLLLAAAKADGTRSHALISLMLHTACRVGEALALTVEDFGIDMGMRVVRIHGKGGKIRVLPLTDAAVIDALGVTEGLLFPMAQSTAFRLIQRLAATAGIEQADRITPHSLRHTAITAALEEAPVHVVQDFAGHADPKLTQRYNRARHNLLNSPALALANYWSAA